MSSNIKTTSYMKTTSNLPNRSKCTKPNVSNRTNQRYETKTTKPNTSNTSNQKVPKQLSLSFPSAWHSPSLFLIYSTLYMMRYTSCITIAVTRAPKISFLLIISALLVVFFFLRRASGGIHARGSQDYC